VVGTTWNSECNGGEVESKNGFEEHHSARGRSRKLRFTEGCREGEPGQRRAKRDTALYSRDPGRPFQEERVRPGRLQRNAVLSMGRTVLYGILWELNDTDNLPRFKAIEDWLSFKIDQLD
jgi:hypothetical protein